MSLSLDENGKGETTPAGVFACDVEHEWSNEDKERAPPEYVGPDVPAILRPDAASSKTPAKAQSVDDTAKLSA